MTVAFDVAAAVLAHAGDAIIYAGRDGSIVMWNAAATRVFGFDQHEAVGQSLDLIIPEKLREAHWRGYDRAMHSGALRLAGAPTVTRGAHKSGARIYVEMTFAVVRNPEGEPIGSVAVARDVTARIEEQKRK